MNTSIPDTNPPHQAGEDGFWMLMDLASTYYWQEDASCHCTFLRTSAAADNQADTLIAPLRHNTLWGIGAEVVGGSWAPHLQQREARKPFRNLICRLRAGAQIFYLNVSGQPRFEHNTFTGYHCIATDISHLKEIRRKTGRLQQMYAALSSTTAGILRAPSEQAMYQDLCQAAIGSDMVTVACVFVPAGEQRLTPLAWAGPPRPLSDILLSPETDASSGSLVETAYRSGAYGVSNDYMHDPRTAAWHKVAVEYDLASVAAFPLLLHGKTMAVLLLYANETDVFDEDIIGLLQNMADNVSFVLQNLHSEAERREAVKVLRESEARFRSLTQLTSDFYWEMDASLRFTAYEGEVSMESNRHSVNRLIGNHLWNMDPRWVHPTSMTWAEFEKLLGKRKRFRDFEFRFVNAEEMVYHMALSGEPIFDENDTFIGYRGITRDVTDRKRASEHIRFLATHDALTQLPNRVMFAQLLEQATRLAIRDANRAFTLLFLDLDRFKLVNDTFGHQVGDDLLVEVGRRLRASLRASDVIARTGGDEFVILLPEITCPSKISAIANKILEAFTDPILLDDKECRVTASLGISVFGADADDGATMMKHADAAMYVAKDEGRDNFQFYSELLHQRAQERGEIEIRLRHALENQELQIFWQPKIHLDSGIVAGVEALLRWNSPELGIISPQEFIPIAEESGLIIPIGDWVARTACQQLAEWQQEGVQPLCLAVNLSLRQLQDPQFLDDIRSALQESGVEPHWLELEITESTVASHPRRTLALLQELKDMGVKLALDDFGNGYSSLGQLKHYPIDTLKIDRAFLAGFPQNDDKAIVHAIITMGRTLGLTVVAEGVETWEQVQLLAELGCHQAQGFYFLRPLPADEFRHWLSHYDPLPVRALR